MFAKSLFNLKAYLVQCPIHWVGRCFYFLVPIKYSIAKSNIQQVFDGFFSDDEKKRITMAYYSHIFLCLKEIALYPLIRKKWLSRPVQVIGVEHLYQALEQEKGVLVLTGHFGNWEFAPLFLLDNLSNIPNQLYCVRKSLRFSFLNSFFIGRYKKAGIKIIERKNALSHASIALKNKHIVFLPFDLRPPNKSKSSLRVNFLGQPSNTYTSAAYLSYKLDCPVLSVSFYRLTKKQHVIAFYPPIQSDIQKARKDIVRERTQSYNKRLEDMVIARPEQWLWSYKRW